MLSLTAPSANNTILKEVNPSENITCKLKKQPITKIDKDNSEILTVIILD